MLSRTCNSVISSVELSRIHLDAEKMRRSVSSIDALSDMVVLFVPGSSFYSQVCFSCSSQRSSNLIKLLVDIHSNLGASILQIVVFLMFPAIFRDFFIFAAESVDALR